MEDRLRLEFNEWAKAGRGESMERGHRPVGEQAIEKMRVPDDARVLDVGCGSGWASRLLAEKAQHGRVTGFDISDEMIRVAREASTDFGNLEFQVASAEDLPFDSGAFTHAFSMESLYYYSDMSRALAEIHRVLERRGLFVTVVDLYQENEASHQWVEQLQVPVQLLSIAQYHLLFKGAGFAEIADERILDPAPVLEKYTGTSFRSHEDYLEYRAAGSLMISARAEK
jgi:ubiquinone/menaquinone biosynthesis C-methylase UbiE